MWGFGCPSTKEGTQLYLQRASHSRWGSTLNNCLHLYGPDNHQFIVNHTQALLVAPGTAGNPMNLICVKEETTDDEKVGPVACTSMEQAAMVVMKTAARADV